MVGKNSLSGRYVRVSSRQVLAGKAYLDPSATGFSFLLPRPLRRSVKAKPGRRPCLGNLLGLIRPDRHWHSNCPLPAPEKDGEPVTRGYILSSPGKYVGSSGSIGLRGESPFFAGIRLNPLTVSHTSRQGSSGREPKNRKCLPQSRVRSSKTKED